MNKTEIKKVFQKTHLELLQDEIIQTVNIRADEPFTTYTNFRFVSINEESIDFDFIIGPKRFICSLSWQTHLSNLSLLQIRKN